MRFLPFITFVALAVVGSTNAFLVVGPNKVAATTSSSSTALKARGAYPTFDKETQKWVKAKSDDGEYPYDAIGALLRHGPAPFFTRITNPDEFEQGVLKYMAVAKVSRAEATGNMDAKINNAVDWAFYKMEEKRTGKKIDFTYLDKTQAIKTGVWAVFIIPTVAYVVEKTISEVMNH